MDETNYTTEHRKGQHLTSEERHIIEVRWNKDKRSIYGIAKELGRPYNTVKNEIMRGTVLLYNGKVRRYKADIGYSVYLEHRQECRRKYRCLETSAFLQYVSKHFRENKMVAGCLCLSSCCRWNFSKRENCLHKNALPLCGSRLVANQKHGLAGKAQ